MIKPGPLKTADPDKILANIGVTTDLIGGLG